ncbi:Vinorine synthase [Glycine soja]
MDEIVDTPLGVQLNVFECGGIAIGACMSHKIADAMSYFMFIQTWAAIARGEARDYNEINTHFVSSTLVPPRDIPWYDPNKTITKPNTVSEDIYGLKAKYAEKMALQKPPSRVEALTTFIWTRFISSTQVAVAASDQRSRFYVVAHTVNLRSRMDLPLPALAFGNYYRAGNAYSYELVEKLREEIRKIDRDYILKLQEGSEYLDSLREDLRRFENIKGEVVPFTFTALCRFPVYDADFGWGKPIWACPPAWYHNSDVIIAANMRKITTSRIKPKNVDKWESQCQSGTRRVYSVEEKMQVAPTLAGLTLSTWCSRNTETESRTQKESRFDDSSEL